MSRLFLNNFSFEQALNPGYQPARPVVRFEDELACSLLAVAEADDKILCSASPSPGELDELAACTGIRASFVTVQEAASAKISEIVPWGWTPAVRKLASQLGVSVHAPDQDSVRMVNSRQFSSEVSQDLGCDLPGECVVRSLPELMPAIQRIHQQSGKWIIKPNFSQAGRGQLRGESPFLSEAQLGTLLHVLSGNGVVAIEPLLQPVQEFGWQWGIFSDGRPHLYGVAQLLTDDRGRYIGSRVQPDQSLTPQWAEVERLHRQVLERMFATGYFGPVGIDTMVYRDGENEQIRPLQEINARWTMGRLALEWSRRLGSTGAWLHRPDVGSPNEIPLSPVTLGGETVGHRTWWCPDQIDASR